MRAARIYEYGGPEVFRVEEVEDLQPGPGEVLVGVHAAAVNPVDWKIRKGAHRAIIKLQMPAVLGMDVSGEVLALGAGVDDLEVGDEVFSSPSHKRQGCYAEQVVLRREELARKPSNLSHEEAASLPLVALTAYACLVDAADLQEGERCFVQAGSGGVGSIAVQIAHHLGAYVITTCSARNADWVSDLGADEVIDYRSQRFEDVIEANSIDVALDTFGGETTERLFTIVKPGGRITSITADLVEYVTRRGPYLGVACAGIELGKKIARARLGEGIKLKNVVRSSDGRALSVIADWAEQGAIRPIVDRVFTLDEIAEAHRYSEEGHAAGKIVIRMDAA